MTYNAKDPEWINRDRFILSAGHGSMFLYSWLNLAGFDLPIDELKQFRQHHSMTPGHPEFPSSEHNTPGIECTTGPLGQGVSNAVGMAASEKMAAAVYNTEEHTIFDHHVYERCAAVHRGHVRNQERRALCSVSSERTPFRLPLPPDRLAPDDCSRDRALDANNHRLGACTT